MKMDEVEVTLCEDGRTVMLMAPNGDDYTYAAAEFVLDREYTDDEFYDAWNYGGASKPHLVLA